MTYIKNVLIALDQVGNAIAGGNPDCTISGRTGYFQYNAVKPFPYYWKLLAVIIDATFYPVDSHHHCREAYLAEKDEEFYATENIWVLSVLSIITLFFCFVIGIILWTIYGIKWLVKYIRSKTKKENK